jgi:hypothetical protein
VRGDDVLRRHARRLLESSAAWRPRPAEEVTEEADLARVETLTTLLCALTDGKPEQRQQIARIFAGA